MSWSLLVLLLTSAVQAGVFVLTGSIALLADLIHNFGDALTAIPLGIAFLLRSFKPGSTGLVARFRPGRKEE